MPVKVSHHVSNTHLISPRLQGNTVFFHCGVKLCLLGYEADCKQVIVIIYCLRSNYDI